MKNGMKKGMKKGMNYNVHGMNEMPKNCPSSYETHPSSMKNDNKTGTPKVSPPC